MSLEGLYQQLNINNESLKSNGKPLPPIETWQPDYCGEIDIQIKTNGDWYHQGSLIKRLSLAQLFSTVLWREVTAISDDYFLVTPVEKVKITVEDAPFMLTQWHWQDQTQQTMVVSTSLGDEFVLDKGHPIELDGQGHLYVTVRRNLLAKVHRNVYYQWAELAEEVSGENRNSNEGDSESENKAQLAFYSAGQCISLGNI